MQGPDADDPGAFRRADDPSDRASRPLALDPQDLLGASAGMARPRPRSAIRPSTPPAPGLHRWAVSDSFNVSALANLASLSPREHILKPPLAVLLAACGSLWRSRATLPVGSMQMKLASDAYSSAARHVASL
jgi:hypothetical protein